MDETAPNHTSRRMPPPERDEGIGLVEIVVAMFVLATIAVAFLPLLVSSLQLSIRTAQTNTATQLLNEQLDLLTGTSPTCAALTAFVSATVTNVVDERGVTYALDRISPSCSAAPFPRVVAVELSVSINDGSGREQIANSAFLVTAAG